MTRTAKPRLTARERRMVAREVNLTADPEAEQEALWCLAWVFRDFPVAAARMLDQLRPQLVTVDGAEEVLEAAGLAAWSNRLNQVGQVITINCHLVVARGNTAKAIAEIVFWVSVAGKNEELANGLEEGYNLFFTTAIFLWTAVRNSRNEIC